jgi:hypothetical protein
VATFLAETYLSRERAEELPAATARLEAAAAELARGRTGDGGAAPRVATRHVRSYFVPADETCIHVIEAPSRAAVEAVVGLAGIAADRIVEASAEGPEPGE